MKRIIITFGPEIDEETAIQRVSNVVKQGRISEHKHGKHYCWVTAFTNNEVVSVRPRKEGQTSDSFHVYRSASKGKN
jgi:hypothetical protein